MDQELTYKWVQERLRELSSGTLPEKDRLRLMEIAREDPFLADALEGYHLYPDTVHDHHLEILTNKIQSKKRERRRWLIPNLAIQAIAASFIILFATWAVINRMSHQEKENIFVMVSPDSTTTFDTIAENIALGGDERMSNAAKEISSPSAHARTDESKSESDETKKENTQTTSPKNETIAKPKDEKSIARAEPAAKLSDQDDLTGKELVRPDEYAISTEPVPVPAAVEAEMANDKELTGASTTANKLSNRDEGYYANQMDPAIMRRRVTGRLVDALSSEPIPSAKLTVNYSNQVFYPDSEGRFELFIPEAEAVLEVSYPGYGDSAFVVRQEDENLLVGLKPGTMISPVMAGAKGKGPVHSVKNSTVESHRNFSSYLKASSLLQLSTEPSSARRKVTVEFTVRNDGHPRDVKISESSRDKTYDEEAVRLIESGPDWVCPGDAYPCVRQYTFLFR